MQIICDFYYRESFLLGKSLQMGNPMPRFNPTLNMTPAITSKVCQDERFDPISYPGSCERRQRRASGAPGSRSEARAETGGRRLHALVRPLALLKPSILLLLSSLSSKRLYVSVRFTCFALGFLFAELDLDEFGFG